MPDLTFVIFGIRYYSIDMNCSRNLIVVKERIFIVVELKKQTSPKKILWNKQVLTFQQTDIIKQIWNLSLVC